MSEATTYGASVAALQTLDQKAQNCEHEAGRLSGGVKGMTTSQAALDAALTRFELDQRALGASKRLQESTGALERLVGDVAASAGRFGASSQATLASVGQHRRLAQAVQEHDGAAQMGWYRNGR